MPKFQLALLALVAALSLSAAQDMIEPEAAVTIADGDLKTGSVAGSDIVQFTYTVDGTTFADDEFDIHVTLDVLLGDCDLVIKGPRRFLEYSEHPSGADVVYVGREKIRAVCADFSECVFRILVVGYSPVAEYELLFDVSKETRLIHTEDQAVLEAIWNQCCKTEGACMGWGVAVEASGSLAKENFCHLRDQICDSNGRITHLQLSDSQMWCTLPSEIANLRSLQRLTLSHNSISGRLEDVLTIAKGLKKLKHVHLAANQMTGELQCCPETDTQCLDHLKTLDVKDNAISGSLPECILELPEIGVLDLRGNQLSGTFPEKINKNKHMVVLDVREQEAPGMHGELPSFKDLENLALLGLSLNSFSGAFPELPPKLEAVHLSSNFLEGDMHPSVWGLEKIWIFEASDNKLTGPIPDNLAKMPTLKVLNVANNQLDGSIPEAWETFSLRLLQLNNNRLSGSLPGNLATLNRVVVLDVSNNNLSGNLDGFANNLGFNSFRQFVVSNNNFNGSISPDFERLGTFSYYPMIGGSFTQIFDVSFNKLDGDFPDFLLQSLVRLKEGMGEGFHFSVQGNYLACPDNDTGDFIKNQLPDLANSTCKDSEAADLRTIDGSPVPEEVVTAMRKEEISQEGAEKDKQTDGETEEGSSNDKEVLEELLPNVESAVRTVTTLATQPSQDGGTGPPLGVIIGAAIGGVVALAALAFLLTFFVVKPLMRRQRNRQYTKEVDAEAADNPVFQEHASSDAPTPTMTNVEMS
mmetsp:Transcript_39644/g.112428  ORF Transcript_39644/g.112428 Transcript_39644/m.112428 type:complete len:752 (+) Transcript_39644:1227-3482(+)|eukprot:CAMPEP_0117656774 /NCGR_PEP_ID=MMETSP0804-20121206/4981_1 /TAXON_ID=1074897 /ORGANISM="Tetraselmis astigmatica, Strain CCMP880" /LENGTH=751 /DNA_ID=CAMNT_0005463193 /DNA_START=706 /DNA_END=2961 /DNA_ORIENTATION=-